MKSLHKRLLVFGASLAMLTVILTACHINDTPLTIFNDTGLCTGGPCTLTKVNLAGPDIFHNYTFSNIPPGRTNVGTIDSGTYNVSTQSSCHNLPPTPLSFGPGPWELRLFCGSGPGGSLKAEMRAAPLQ